MRQVTKKIQAARIHRWRVRQAAGRRSDLWGMKHQEPTSRDARVKCLGAGCGRWMRFNPTPKTPAHRRRSPYAHLCIDCPIVPLRPERKHCDTCGRQCTCVVMSLRCVAKLEAER